LEEHGALDTYSRTTLHYSPLKHRKTPKEDRRQEYGPAIAGQNKSLYKPDPARTSEKLYLHKLEQKSSKNRAIGIRRQVYKPALDSNQAERLI
jgi:hypothetical protein